MMGDASYLVLLKIDFSDMESIKGVLVFKIGYRDIISADAARSDPARLKLQVLKQSLSYKSSLDANDG